MRKIIKSVIILVFFATAAKAQPLFEETYKDCITGNACLYCGDSVARPKKSLQRVADNIQWKLDHSPIIL